MRGTERVCGLLRCQLAPHRIAGAVQPYTGRHCADAQRGGCLGTCQSVDRDQFQHGPLAGWQRGQVLQQACRGLLGIDALLQPDDVVAVQQPVTGDPVFSRPQTGHPTVLSRGHISGDAVQPCNRAAELLPVAGGCRDRRQKHLGHKISRCVRITASPGRVPQHRLHVLAVERLERLRIVTDLCDLVTVCRVSHVSSLFCPVPTLPLVDSRPTRYMPAPKVLRARCFPALPWKVSCNQEVPAVGYRRAAPCGHRRGDPASRRGDPDNLQTSIARDGGSLGCGGRAIRHHAEYCFEVISAGLSGEEVEEDLSTGLGGKAAVGVVEGVFGER